MALHNEWRSKSRFSAGCVADVMAMSVVDLLRPPLAAAERSSLEAVSHMCYGRRMADVGSRELRNNTRSLLERVEAGESITITLDGRPVATLLSAGHRPRFVTRERFVRDLLTHRADPALRATIRDLAPDATDDILLE